LLNGAWVPYNSSTDTVDKIVNVSSEEAVLEIVSSVQLNGKVQLYVSCDLLAAKDQYLCLIIDEDNSDIEIETCNYLPAVAINNTLLYFDDDLERDPVDAPFLLDKDKHKEVFGYLIRQDGEVKYTLDGKLNQKSPAIGNSLVLRAIDEQYYIVSFADTGKYSAAPLDAMLERNYLIGTDGSRMASLPVLHYSVGNIAVVSYVYMDLADGSQTLKQIGKFVAVIDLSFGTVIDEINVGTSFILHADPDMIIRRVDRNRLLDVLIPVGDQLVLSDSLHMNREFDYDGEPIRCERAGDMLFLFNATKIIVCDTEEYRILKRYDLEKRLLSFMADMTNDENNPDQ
jgi:hypothetical protein